MSNEMAESIDQKENDNMKNFVNSVFNQHKHNDTILSTSE